MPWAGLEAEERPQLGKGGREEGDEGGDEEGDEEDGGEAVEELTRQWVSDALGLGLGLGLGLVQELTRQWVAARADMWPYSTGPPPPTPHPSSSDPPTAHYEHSTGPLAPSPPSFLLKTTHSPLLVLTVYYTHRILTVCSPYAHLMLAV